MTVDALRQSLSSGRLFLAAMLNDAVFLSGILC